MTKSVTRQNLEDMRKESNDPQVKWAINITLQIDDLRKRIKELESNDR